jgi:hypothetical protein
MNRPYSWFESDFPTGDKLITDDVPKTRGQNRYDLEIITSSSLTAVGKSGSN